MSYDWSRFSQRIPINASTDAVYNAWASQKGLESWFLREANFVNNEGVQKAKNDLLRPGDKYEWRWHGWPDDVQEKGTILSANHKDELSFSFGDAGNVKVQVLVEKGVTICQLEQYDIPTDERGMTYYHLGCTKGWLFYLTNLKSILEGGIDLRNKDVELKDVVNS
jgi:uncharacterized protein YndB with AHSA1/START domain